MVKTKWRSGHDLKAGETGAYDGNVGFGYWGNRNSQFPIPNSWQNLAPKLPASHPPQYNYDGRQANSKFVQVENS